MLEYSNNIAHEKLPSSDLAKPYIYYEELLKGRNLEFLPTKYHLQVGKQTKSQGWILHLSVIRTQFLELAELIISFCLARKIVFQIPVNADIHSAIIDGRLGPAAQGKVFKVYPQNDDEALLIAKELIQMTDVFRGPSIPTDRHLGGILYARYGSWRSPQNLSENGRLENYIVDGNGQLVKDEYKIPFQLPDAVIWPFSAITTLDLPVLESILLDKYKPIKTLKKDTKGDVKKGLYLPKWYDIRWCILKEGRENMVYDEAGRSIKDRLAWQQEIHNALMAHVPLPNIYDFFEINGQSYLAMEYIKGKKLDDVVTAIYHGKSHRELSIDNKKRLFHFAVQLVDYVAIFHQNGYIHRDVTPVNFLVKKNDQLVLIDVELTYSFKDRKPTPAFRLGTPWFMSPEQEITAVPTVKEDVYAVGGTLVVLFTGLLPDKFAIDRPDLIADQLLYFIPDRLFVSCLARCFEHTPSNRPEISDLKSALEGFKSRSLRASTPNPNSYSTAPPDKNNVVKIVSRAMAGLASSRMTTYQQLWFSKNIADPLGDHIYSEECAVHEGFYIGVTGILYVLSKLHKSGVSIEPCKKAYYRGIDFLRDALVNGKEMRSDLYLGASGILLAFGAAVSAGLVPYDREIVQQFKSRLSLPIDTLDVANGLAGQGIALLNTRSFLGESIALPLLQDKVQKILQAQTRTGAWLTKMPADNKLVETPSFANGVSGIVNFLLKYNTIFPHASVRHSVLSALHWLQSIVRRHDGIGKWSNLWGAEAMDASLNDGTAGIALTFIKAFEYLRDPVYKQQAENILRKPFYHSSSRDLTQASGITGIGEVYLEAFKIFKNKEWEQRAGHIVELLAHQYQVDQRERIFWVTDGSSNPTADFMLGNSGILHFLSRYCQPECLSFPILS